MKNWTETTSKEKHEYEMTKEWQRKRFSIMLDFAPSIYPCKTCGEPRAAGYCCSWCGESE